MKSRFIILMAVLSILLSACTLSLADDITPPPDYKSPTPGPTMSPLFPQNPPSLASGAAIFAEKCAPCHGDKGLGDGPMAAQLQKVPAAVGKPEIARVAAPANWYTTVTQGNINSFMPPFSGSLSDQQRWDVVAYTLSLGGSTFAEAQKGKVIFEANCVKCHDPNSTTPSPVTFTDQGMMAKLTQTDIANFVNKGVGKMPGFGGLIPDEDIFAVAAYVRTFSVVAGEVAAAATPVPPTATSAPDANATPSVDAGTPAATESSAAATTPTETTGVVQGKVVNGSDGSDPSTLKAVLHVFEHDPATQQFSEVSTQEAPIAADGAYSFKDVRMLANQAFYVSVDYADTTYESEPAFPKEGESTIELPVTIYSTTTDTSALVADQMHILLDYSKPNIVQVVEFLVVSNPGTKSVVAAEKGGPVVKVSLPKGYTNLQFDQGAIGDRYIKTDDGFADTTSVVPGTGKYQLVFAIDLPLPKPGLFGGQQLTFSQPIALKAAAASVLVPEGVTLQGANFTPGGTQSMGTAAKYQVYTTGVLEPGKTLDVSASGAPKSATTTDTSTNSSQNIIIGVGAFGLLLIVIGVYLFWRDRQKLADEDDEEDDDDNDDDADETEKEEIMDAIVALDDQYKAGNITESAYKDRRAELKAKLKALN